MYAKMNAVSKVWDVQGKQRSSVCLELQYIKVEKKRYEK